MTDLAVGVTGSVIGAAIVALIAIVWKQFIRQFLLSWLHGTPDIKGVWSAIRVMEQRQIRDEIDITYQAGNDIRGTRTVHTDPTRKYEVRGWFKGSNLALLCIPTDKKSTRAVSRLFKMIDPRDLMRGQLLSPEGTATGIEPSDIGHWRRESQ